MPGHTHSIDVFTLVSVVGSVNQDYSEQNEVDGMKKGADSTGKVMHM